MAQDLEEPWPLEIFGHSGEVPENSHPIPPPPPPPRSTPASRFCNPWWSGRPCTCSGAGCPMKARRRRHLLELLQAEWPHRRPWPERACSSRGSCLSACFLTGAESASQATLVNMMPGDMVLYEGENSDLLPWSG